MEAHFYSHAYPYSRPCSPAYLNTPDDHELVGEAATDAWVLKRVLHPDLSRVGANMKRSRTQKKELKLSGKNAHSLVWKI